MAALSFDKLGLTNEGTDRTVRALDALSLEVAQGEPVAVIGPSGCGKSTMLLVAAGLLSPTEGEVRVDGERLGGPRLETALILQDFGLLPWKTVEQNAALGLTVRGVAREQVRERTRAALDLVGLGDFARAYPVELSGGMRQRLALARAVALDADVLLMDEPLSALDALKREDLQDVLLDLYATDAEYSADALEGIYLTLEKVSSDVLQEEFSDKDAATYTNFYLLSKYSSAIPNVKKDDIFGGEGSRQFMIDRQRPAQSLLLQYSMPAGQTDLPHPQVPNFRPLFVRNTDPAYRRMLLWIDSGLRRRNNAPSGITEGGDPRS